MSSSSDSDSSNEDFTPAADKDQEMNSDDEIIVLDKNGPAKATQQQFKNFRERFIKMEMELKETKNLHMITKLELENLKTEQQKLFQRISTLEKINQQQNNNGEEGRGEMEENNGEERKGEMEENEEEEEGRKKVEKKEEEGREEMEEKEEERREGICQQPEKNRLKKKQTFCCAQCQKNFCSTSNLVMHMRTHTGERPYKCNDCGKGFSRMSNLKEHRHVHTGEKNYSCGVCGKRFARMSNLKEHRHVHMEKKA